MNNSIYSFKARAANIANLTRHGIEQGSIAIRQERERHKGRIVLVNVFEATVAVLDVKHVISSADVDLKTNELKRKYIGCTVHSRYLAA
jgi:hypothetical protein